MEKKRLIIIDSNALIHRAFHALPPLTTKKGELVNAVYGFLLVFFKAIKEFQPDYIVAAFDLPGPTFRNKKFKAYKAKRPPAPEELYSQIPKVKEVLKVFNVPVLEKQGYEADDIIGTISKSAPRKQVVPEIETIIISGDLDVLQLVDSNTKVYFLRRGVKDTVLYDENLAKERYQGLNPGQLLDFRALRGDPSDNIPGVPGIGEKTAIKLIKEFGTLENLYSALNPVRDSKDEVEIREKQISNGVNQRPLQKAVLIRVNQRLRAKLEEYKEQAFLSRMLADIRRDVPLNFNITKCQWGDYDQKKVIKVLESFNFNTLVKRLPEIEGKGVKQEKTKNPLIKQNLKLW